MQEQEVCPVSTVSGKMESMSCMATRGNAGKYEHVRVKMRCDEISLQDIFHRLSKAFIGSCRALWQ
jgi:hypothetical protein